jgi:hypothetical protein
MKHFIVFLFAITILGCNENYKKGDLLGTWDFVSTTNIETGKVELPENEDSVFVEIKSDSLYLDSYDTIAWRIVGDSVFLVAADSVYIKKLTNDTLIVEYDFFGKTLLTFKKRK